MVLGANGFFAPSVGSFQVPVTAPDIDPDDGDQVTVCFAVAWLPFVLGALQQLTLQATWQGDSDAILLAQSRAQLLLAIIGSEVGGCAESVCFDGVFYDGDCDCIKQTPPGGGSPIDQPGADPRHNTAFQFPPIDADDPQCKAANNMVAFIQSLIDEVLLVVDATGEAAGLVGFLMPFFLELGPFAVFLEIVLELASLLLGAGGTALTAAFTTGMYDQLTCIFFCNTEADGSVTAADLVVIESQIASDIGGLAQTILDAMLLIMGEVGLSNAGTMGDAAADCSGCDCPWVRVCDFTIEDYGFAPTAIPDWTPDCSYVAGVGFVTPVDSTRPGFSDHSVQMGMGRLLPDAHFTQIDVDGAVTWGANAIFTNSVDLKADSTVLSTLTDPASFPFSWAGSYDSSSTHLVVSGVVGYKDPTPPGGSMVISKITFHGTGTEPDIGVPG